jgi:prepilin-type N-terminal cleavage/methylation domain-containing protein
MKNSGFTIIEVMVSLVVILLIVAGTTGVMTYQGRLGAYQVRAGNAQQAVETALALIRNDLMQAGGFNGIWWDASNQRLFIKYNGFLNFEALSAPPGNCQQVRGIACPALDCADNRCGIAWQIVASDGSFTMDRIPKYIGYDVTTGGAAFVGALNVSGTDCKTLLGASLLSSVTQTTGKAKIGLPCESYVQELKFVPKNSFTTGSFAAPAIVYQVQSGKLLRNGEEILGGDISIGKLSKTDYAKYMTLVLEYVWTPPSTLLFQPVSSSQEISVGMLQGTLLRMGG